MDCNNCQWKHPDTCKSCKDDAKDKQFQLIRKIRADRYSARL